MRYLFHYSALLEFRCGGKINLVGYYYHITLTFKKKKKKGKALKHKTKAKRDDDFKSSLRIQGCIVKMRIDIT